MVYLNIPSFLISLMLAKNRIKAVIKIDFDRVNFFMASYYSCLKLNVNDSFDELLIYSNKKIRSTNFER